MRTVGFRVKSGFAIAAIVNGTARNWRIESCREVMLAPETGRFARFPFHPLVELEGEPAVAESREAVAAVQASAATHLASFLESAGALAAAGIVVGSLANPDTLSNAHIRAHAREAELFRGVITRALDAANIPYVLISEKDAYSRVAAERGCREAQLRAEVSTHGKGVVTPWRAEQKLAALGAAWRLSAA
jgi:hypothetical protein